QWPIFIDFLPDLRGAQAQLAASRLRPLEGVVAYPPDGRGWIGAGVEFKLPGTGAAAADMAGHGFTLSGGETLILSMMAPPSKIWAGLRLPFFVGFGCAFSGG